jgi:hypothetical protein
LGSQVAQHDGPKDLAPNLHSQARFKLTVAKELQHFNWIKNLKQINTEELLEFALLFSTLAYVQLT